MSFIAQFIAAILVGGAAFISGTFFGRQATPHLPTTLATPPVVQHQPASITPPSTGDSSPNTSDSSPVVFGDTFTPAQIPQTYLSGGGATASQSTIPLSSFKTRDGRAVTMSMFGTIAYGTLEPGTSKEEIISFGGVTQNSDGSATLTSVSRGLDFVSPYAASTTLQKSHGGNATFIITNTSPFYSQYVTKNNAETITGNDTFTGTVTFSNFPITPSNSIASYNAAGVSTLATPAQQAASTATSSSATLVLAAKNATSTYNANTAPNKVLITGAAGLIDPNFITGSAGASSTVLTWTPTGTLASYFPNWVLLTSTTTVNTMLNATTSSFAAHANLHVIILTKGKSSTSDIAVNFNTDYGANYGSAIYTLNQGGAPAFPVLSSFTNMQIDPGTTTPQLIEMDIMNFPTTAKNIVIRGSSASSGTSVPVIWQGAGIWNNTSAPITSIGLSSGGATTFTAGTTIYVYGSD